MNGFEKRTEIKKRQILNAAFQLMNTRQGIKNVTIDKLAQQSKVGKTTIFKYFGNKEGVIHQVFKNYINSLTKEAEKIIAANYSFEKSFILLSNSKVHYIKKIHHQFYLDLMDYTTRPGGSGISLLMQKYTKDTVNVMLDLFHRGKKEGKVDLKYSDEFLLIYFQAIVEGISKPQIYEHIAPYTNEWTELLLKGIAPDKKRV